MSDENDAARRQAALRALAQSQTQQPTSASPAPQATRAAARAAKTPKTSTQPSALAARVLKRPSSGRRRIIAIGVTLAAVAIIAVVVVAVLGGQRKSTPPKTSVRLTPALDGLNCILSVAWSPDGKQIAAQGNTQGCGGSQSDSQTGAVFIYDAQSGRVVQQLQPDLLVFKAPGVEQLVSANVSQFSPPASLYYQGMTWTPDGHTVLLPFSVEVQQPEGQAGAGVGVSGLLQLAVGHTGASHVWLNTISATQSDMIERWDLTSGKTSLTPTPQAATAYQWSSDGTLAPVSGVAGGPVGTPDGGKTFTVWQSGSLSYGSAQVDANSQPIADPQEINWNASTATVSPDGRYFYPYVPAYGSLVPPSTKQAFAHEPRLEPHDKALLALAQRMTLATNPDQQAQILVAWRLDGRLMAEVSQNQSGAGGGAAGAASATAQTFTVSLYDTTTGKLVKRLTPNLAGLQPGEAAREALAWSPDGAHLLLMDNAFGAITIWGPGALP